MSTEKNPNLAEPTTPSKAPWEAPVLVTRSSGVTANGGGHHGDVGIYDSATFSLTGASAGPS